MFTWYTNTSYSLFQKKSLVSQKVPLFPKFDPAVLLLLSIQKNPFFPCPAKTFACDLLPEQKCFFLGCILFDPNGQYIYLVVMCFGTQNSGFLTRIGTKICMEFFWSKLGKSYLFKLHSLLCFSLDRCSCTCYSKTKFQLPFHHQHNNTFLVCT